MQRHEVDLKERLGLPRLATKLLRLLKADAGSPISSVSQEEFVPVAAAVDISYASPKEIRVALLNAERRKTEALTHLQRHQLIR